MTTAMVDAPEAVLRGVSWDFYVQVRDAPGNRHLRMAYHDGTLIVMSPEYVHDQGAERLGLIVREVAVAFHIKVAGTRTTTLRRPGRDRLEGSGKEPDNGFYIGPNEARIRKKKTIDLDVDPPPDLAIEVDNKSDSTLALPIYAALRVPEVWRYDALRHSLWFGSLQAGGYGSIVRSLALPMLTPELVLSALAEAEDVDETTWAVWLRGWAAGLPGRFP